MLSRVAESLFWIGRYVERADGTARILDVHLQLMFEDPMIDESTACHYLLYVLGSPEDESITLTSADVLSKLATDLESTPSIRFSLNSARENARRAREIISTEFWESLNTITQQMPRKVKADRMHAFFHWVCERTAMATGIAQTTMSRDEAYQFYSAGMNLERADMTARLLATRAHSPNWTTLLRSCGAYESCLRTYRGVPSIRNAAEFLLVDRLFPRSVMYSLNRVLTALTKLEPLSGMPDRTNRHADPQWIVGRAISQLEYLAVDEIIDDLAVKMDEIQVATSRAAEAISERYFPADAVPTWVGEQT
ncbi:MAG: alpha-E domain-containing protein [Propionibacteriaceae bacterium]|jgi:uncharacterized alpha-E superfamily protein|nr:alpha-E domain-containing protein [Propionibacteriaceae bacterium]